MKRFSLYALFFSAILLLAPASFVSLGFAQGAAAQDLLGDAAKDQVQNKLDEVTDQVDQNESAQEATQHILSPISEAGEYITALPGFYWIAFAMMAAGLVNFLGQLVLGKLLMLVRFHFSLTEILSDALGLLISLIGLVLLTQTAAAEGTFTNSPTAVLSASIVGAFFGLIFYIRGQTQELREIRAVRLRKHSKVNAR